MCPIARMMSPRQRAWPGWPGVGFGKPLFLGELVEIEMKEGDQLRCVIDNGLRMLGMRRETMES